MKFVKNLGTKYIGILVCASLLMFSGASMSADGLVLGMVYHKSSKMIKRFKPLMTYINDMGIKAKKIVVSKTVDGLVKKLEKGEVDFIIQSPYGAIALMDKAGVIPIILREKSGVKEYNSAIFVKQDSPIQSLDGLIGKVIAFEDATSTSSYRLPRGVLLNAGLKLKESTVPVDGHVAYYFSKDDSNTIAQVKAAKRVDAGGIKRTEVSDNPEFRILQESPYVPRYVVLVRKDFDSNQLKSLLLGMKGDPNAKATLDKINTPTGFSEFSGDPVTYMNGPVRQSLSL